MTFGPDVYHANFNDGPIPLDHILRDDRITFIILKYTEGTSYSWADSWAAPQGQRVRSTRLVLGAYHMLSGGDGSGAAQWAYFVSKAEPQFGDIVPAVDFESSGQNARGATSLAVYRDKLRDYIAAAHADGFEVMLYGHSVVKSAFSDWRDSGADYWWCPGSELHADVGPRGPDLWQYSPYASPFDWPTDPAGIGRTDVSKIITFLPTIGPSEDEMAFADFRDGQQAFLDGKDINADWPADKRAGWRLENRIARAAETPVATGSVDLSNYSTRAHNHPVPNTGPAMEP